MRLQLLYTEIARVTWVDWVIIPMFITLLILAYLRAKERKVLVSVFSLFFSMRVNMRDREEHEASTNVVILLSLNAVLSIATLIYLVNKLYGGMFEPVDVFLYGAVFVGGWFLFKRILNNLIGAITETSNLLEEAKSKSLNYYQVLGIILIPGVICALLFPENVLRLSEETPKYISNVGVLYSLVVICILYIIKLLQIVAQSSDVKISWYYIILYLCTLEILPLIVLYSILIGNFSVLN